MCGLVCDLLPQLSAVLDEDHNLIPGDFPSIVAHFKLLLCRATSERPILIMLDGIDQLSPEDGASGVSWLPLQVPPHVKIILSTSSEIKYRCYPALQSLLSKYPGNMVEVRYTEGSMFCCKFSPTGSSID